MTANTPRPRPSPWSMRRPRSASHDPGAVGAAGAVLDVPGVLGRVPGREAARQVVGVDDPLPVLVLRQRPRAGSPRTRTTCVAQGGRPAAALLDGDDRVHAVDDPAQALLARPEGIGRRALGRDVHHDAERPDPGLAVGQAAAAVRHPDPRPVGPAHPVGQLPGARRGAPRLEAGRQVVRVDEGPPRLVRPQRLRRVAEDALRLGAVDDRVRPSRSW